MKAVYYDTSLGTKVPQSTYHKVVEMAQSRRITVSELFREMVNREVDAFFSR